MGGSFRRGDAVPLLSFRFGDTEEWRRCASDLCWPQPKGDWPPFDDGEDADSARFRRRGLARGLLSTLARECVDNRYTRLAWSVLNWNSDAIALYDRIGGQPQHEWTIYRLSGPRLAALAAPR